MFSKRRAATCEPARRARVFVLLPFEDTGCWKLCSEQWPQIADDMQDEHGNLPDIRATRVCNVIDSVRLDAARRRAQRAKICSTRYPASHTHAHTAVWRESGQARTCSTCGERDEQDLCSSLPRIAIRSRSSICAECAERKGGRLAPRSHCGMAAF